MRCVTKPPHPDSSDPASEENSGVPQTNRVRSPGSARPTGRASSRCAEPTAARARWVARPSDRSRGALRSLAAPDAGLVVLNTGVLSDEQRLWIGVLHAGPGAVLSHLTAARRAGLRWVGSDTIDVMTPKGDLVAPLPGYFFHQTRRPVRPLGDARQLGRHGCLSSSPHCSQPSATRYVRRAIGLLAACVQQGLTTAERFELTIPLIRKLQARQDLQARSRRHRRRRAVVRRDQRRETLRRRRADGPDTPGGPPRQARAAPLPGLRVGAGGRSCDRARDRRVVPRRRRPTGGRT